MGINLEAKSPTDMYMGLLKMFATRARMKEATGVPIMDVTMGHIQQVSPRTMPTLETLNFVGIVHNPSHECIRTLDPVRNEKIAKYTKAEFDLYERGENRAEEFARHAPFWREIANPDGTVNSAYGRLIYVDATCGGTRYPQLTPWEWAYESLKADKDSRQAFVRFSRPDHQWRGNRDQVCTMHGQFLIRDDYLNFTIVMRSNDVVKGMVYDVPWFNWLMYKMRDQLEPIYPGLKIGMYTHIVHSLHVYERDLPLVFSMIGETP